MMIMNTASRTMSVTFPPKFDSAADFGRDQFYSDKPEDENQVLVFTNT